MVVLAKTLDYTATLTGSGVRIGSKMQETCRSKDALTHVPEGRDLAKESCVSLSLRPASMPSMLPISLMKGPWRARFPSDRLGHAVAVVLCGVVNSYLTWRSDCRGSKERRWAASVHTATQWSITGQQFARSSIAQARTALLEASVGRSRVGLAIQFNTAGYVQRGGL